jgi:hypothetical protein
MVLCKCCNKHIFACPIECSICFILYCENCLDKKTKELIKLLTDCRDVIADKNNDLQYYIDIRKKGFINMKKDEIDDIQHSIVYNKGIIHEIKQIMFRYFMILNPRINLSIINYEFENIYKYYVCFDCKKTNNI